MTEASYYQCTLNSLQQQQQLLLLNCRYLRVAFKVDFLLPVYDLCCSVQCGMSYEWWWECMVCPGVTV